MLAARDPVVTAHAANRDAAAHVARLASADPAVLFSDFMREHDKSYASKAEEASRRVAFFRNVEKAKKLNAARKGPHSAVYGVTKFSDMSEEEFKTTILMRRGGFPSPHVDRRVEVTDEELARVSKTTEFSWVKQGAVTDVKDQGTVGTCWAFSAVGNIEGQVAVNAMKSGKTNLNSLSVQQIATCDETTFKNGTGDCGPFGGWPFVAYDYVHNAGGIMTWDDYPYCMGYGKCFPCYKTWNQTVCGEPKPFCSKDKKENDVCHYEQSKAAAKVDGWNFYSKNETELVAQLTSVGPMSIAIDASSLQAYLFGIIDWELCSSDPDSADHAVLLVGWGRERDWFLQMNDYWLVKNSWGATWGELGYFKLERNTNTCGVANFASSASVTAL